MNNAQSLDFPFLAGVPKREKSRIGKLLDVVAELKAVQSEVGPVVCQRTVADILGVSVQRVGQFLDDGRLQGVQIGRGRFVVISSFEQFARMERKSGRPPGYSSKLQQHLENVRAVGQAAGIEV
jgi:hypothetical protein